MRRTLAFALALLGLFDSLYLLWVYTSPSIPMVCLGGGCDTVRASHYSHILGVPVPVYGVVFYLVLAAMLFFATRATRPVLLSVAGVGVAVSAVLTGLEAFVIHAWCLWCVIQALAVTLIFLLLLPRDSDPGPQRPKRIVLIAAILLGIPAFVLLSRAEQQQARNAAPPPQAAEIAQRLIRPDSHATGNLQSSVTFVEFGDLQCPACAATNPTILQLRQRFGDRVRFVFRNFPLESIHSFALGAAQAAECAGQQNRFWEMVDRLYTANGALDNASLQRYAAELSLDTPRFRDCLASGMTLPAIRRDQEDGIALGVRATPTFFVGNRRIEGPMEFAQFAAMLNEDLRAQSSPAPASAPAQAPPLPATKPAAGSNPPAPSSTAAIALNPGGSSGGFLNIQGSSTDCTTDAPKGPEPPVVHTDEAHRLFQDKAVFVDVRIATEFAQQHIAGAIDIPLIEVQRRAKELPAGRTIVTYESGAASSGDVCAAARSAARALLSAGLKKVVVYQDGLAAWKKSSLPTEP